MSDPIIEVYDRFKHLDRCLSDRDWLQGALVPYQVLGEIWKAIKEYVKTKEGKK
jgi:hypothetical protein